MVASSTVRPYGAAWMSVCMHLSDCLCAADTMFFTLWRNCWAAIVTRLAPGPLDPYPNLEYEPTAPVHDQHLSFANVVYLIAC